MWLTLARMHAQRDRQEEAAGLLQPTTTLTHRQATGCLDTALWHYNHLKNSLKSGNLKHSSVIHRPYYIKPSHLLPLPDTAQPCFQGPLCCITSVCCFPPAIKASPYMHTLKGFRRCKSWFGGLFVYLFLNGKLPKFTNCFLILTFYFQQGKSKSPQYK